MVLCIASSAEKGGFIQGEQAHISIVHFPVGQPFEATNCSNIYNLIYDGAGPTIEVGSRQWTPRDAIGGDSGHGQSGVLFRAQAARQTSGHDSPSSE